jgi:hypothetical protein
VWLTGKEELSKRRNDFEDACLVRLNKLVPLGWAVAILADWGFGDYKMLALLDD